MGQLALLGQSLGLASTSLSARAGFVATQAAAAAAGPGAVSLCESYVLDAADAAPAEGRTAGSWQRVSLQYSLGSAQFKGRGSLWQKAAGLRGLCQMRLQAAMVTAAAALGRGGAGGGGGGSEAEHWLMVLAHKIVQVSRHGQWAGQVRSQGCVCGAGTLLCCCCCATTSTCCMSYCLSWPQAVAVTSPCTHRLSSFGCLCLLSWLLQGAPELDGLISHPVQQHEFVTVSRAVYQPGARDWRLAAAHPLPAVESQHRDSSALKVEAVTATAAPGQDG